jgi:hypothetical protein
VIDHQTGGGVADRFSLCDRRQEVRQLRHVDAPCLDSSRAAPDAARWLLFGGLDFAHIEPWRASRCRGVKLWSELSVAPVSDRSAHLRSQAEQVYHPTDQLQVQLPVLESSRVPVDVQIITL